MTTPLPDLPRPDLPASHPENYPTLKVRVLRRLGLPDDGGLYLSDAVDSDVLRGYRGIVAGDFGDFLHIDFASLADAVSWADGVTATGNDRSMITFAGPPASPYAPATLRITLR